MKLNISDEVVELLSKQGKNFLLTLNDGSNQFSNAEGCCMIGDRFLIIATDEVAESYSVEIPSNHLKFYTSKYDCMFLKGDLDLALEKNSRTIILKDKSGILDYNVQLKVL